MADVVQFAQAYHKSIILFITPIVLIPLLTVDPRNVIENNDLCQIYGTQTESCDETIIRLEEGSEKPTLFKVSNLTIINSGILSKI